MKGEEVAIIQSVTAIGDSVPGLRRANVVRVALSHVALRKLHMLHLGLLESGPIGERITCGWGSRSASGTNGA